MWLEQQQDLRDRHQRPTLSLARLFTRDLLPATIQTSLVVGALDQLAELRTLGLGEGAAVALPTGFAGACNAVVDLLFPIDAIDDVAFAQCKIKIAIGRDDNPLHLAKLSVEVISI